MPKLIVELTENQHKALQVSAHENGRTISGHVRYMLRNEISDGVKAYIDEPIIAPEPTKPTRTGPFSSFDELMAATKKGEVF